MSALTLLTGLSLQAQAQGFPDRPIKLVVPFGAGSAVDTIARAVAAQAAEQMGQPIQIDNRTGANGIIAAEAMARSAPDGYTLFMPNDGIMAANPALYAKLPYDPDKDFTAITLTSTVPLVLVTHPSFPANTVQEFIAQAKAKPGALNFTSTGSGSAQHLAMEFLIDAAGIKLTHVPHKAMGAALTDLMAGTIPVMFTGISNVVNLAKEGKVKVLAISTPKRSPVMPNVPTIAESGVAGYGYAAWNGIVAPAGTPPEVVRRLHTEFAKAMANPAVRAKLGGLGFDLVGAGPQEFGDLIRGDVVRLGRLVRTAGIAVN
ncbi:MAG: tripartite tricarboxylate transporter substrate binding protein [Comamonadaceae bacterium]|nr:tripartite tricarboxylate transporter substrate binding protein [Comamonadaceae bacterium]